MIARYWICPIRDNTRFFMDDGSIVDLPRSKEVMYYMYPDAKERIERDISKHQPKRWVPSRIGNDMEGA